MKAATPLGYIFLLATWCLPVDTIAHTGFIELKTQDHLNINDEQRLEKFSDTSKRRFGDSLSGLRTYADAGYNSNQSGTALTRAQNALEDVNILTSAATSRLWFADALTLQVDGAGPQTETVIDFKYSFGGDKFAYDDVGVVRVSIRGCIGAVQCPYLVDQRVLDGAGLPEASGLKEIGVLERQSVVKHQLNPVRLTLKPRIVVLGPIAVVPILYYVDVAAEAGYIVSDGVFTFPSTQGTVNVVGKISLPRNVHCHSRTGRAFFGECPSESSR
jgi:hypothetical protein